MIAHYRDICKSKHEKRFIRKRLDKIGRPWYTRIRARGRAPYIWEIALAWHPPTHVPNLGIRAVWAPRSRNRIWEFALARHRAGLGAESRSGSVAGRQFGNSRWCEHGRRAFGNSRARVQHLGIRAGASTYARRGSL